MRCMLLIMMLATLLTGCKKRNRTLMFEVPAGFRGQFEIVEDPKGTSLDWSKDILVVRVPQDGTIRVKDFRVFATEHAVSARWSSGEPLAVEDFDEAVGDGLILRSLGASPMGHLVYDVGQKKQN